MRGDAGQMTITLDGESMKNDPAQCSLTFERSYNEVFPVGFVSGALPSGSTSAPSTRPSPDRPARRTR